MKQVCGSTVVASGTDTAAMYEIVYVGVNKLMGEIIALELDDAIIQAQIE